MFSRLIKLGVCLYAIQVVEIAAASLDELLIAPSAAQQRYDTTVQSIKAGRLKGLALSINISPENSFHSAVTGAVTKYAQADTAEAAPAKAALHEPVLASNTDLVTIAWLPTMPESDSSPKQQTIAPPIMLSSLNESQITALRQQTAQRLKRKLVYQPHPLAPMFAVIPAGRFRMGDISGRGDFDEGPVRELEISKPYGMSTTEVSFDTWYLCINAGACSDALHKQRGGDQSWGKGRRPVINISWSEIQNQFIPWLNEVTGEHFRLPTEAEWEYAARAGTDTPYSVDAKLIYNYANLGKEKCCGGFKKDLDIWQFTAPVGSLKPNIFGLYDMHGNVYEWVADCYSGSYDAPPSAECASGKRVARGGSWYDFPQSLRSANRVKFSEQFRIIYLGFRLVHVVE